MFGGILRLMAVGEAGRRLGDYAKSLATKYLMLGAAGMIFLIAIGFGILDAFWGLTSSTHNPVISAAIMAGALALIGLLIALIAYGITGRKQLSARQALRGPLPAVQGQMPSVEDVGRQIEYAVRRYGPIPVTAAAAAGGFAAGILAKRLGQAPSYPRTRFEEGPEFRRPRRHGRLRRRDQYRTAPASFD